MCPNSVGLCSVQMIGTEWSMRLDLDGLAAASREALMSEWRAVVGRPPPKHMSRPLMVQILSHAYQLVTVGGYTKRLDGRLKSTARRDVV
ncbi:MAG: DUF2924 domain-containing protein, partial [Betaproteobacteria bacterium]|nr:DUF2924 domain-containing protein [Betaproteobacteria bacterium]